MAGDYLLPGQTTQTAFQFLFPLGELQKYAVFSQELQRAFQRSEGFIQTSSVTDACKRFQSEIISLL